MLTNEQADKVDVRMFLLGNHHLVRHFHCWRPAIKWSRADISCVISVHKCIRTNEIGKGLNYIC